MRVIKGEEFWEGASSPLAEHSPVIYNVFIPLEIAVSRWFIMVAHTFPGKLGGGCPDNVK